MTSQARWIRFAMVGALGVVLQLAVVEGLTGHWQVDYRWATVVGVLSAVAHNFAWHRRWTWRDRPDSRGTVVTFLAFAGGNGLVSLAGNLLVMRALVGSLHTPILAANIVAIATCAAANYLLADKAIFRMPPHAFRSPPNPL
ncbi:MAG: GtrA family protein [Acidobacteriota bacterium]